MCAQYHSKTVTDILSYHRTLLKNQSFPHRLEAEPAIAPENFSNFSITETHYRFHFLRGISMRRTITIYALVLIAIASTNAFGQHFRFDVNQGNHSLLVEESRVNGEFIEAGNEVGVFTPGGVCAGALVYEQNGGESIGIAAWGDDQDQAGVNGFRAGERFAFRFWDRTTNHEFTANPTFDFGPEGYERDAFTILSLEGTLEGPPVVVIREGDNVLGQGGGDQMSHDFGNVLVDESQAWVITIGNGGIDPLEIESMTTSSGEFTTNFPENGLSLEPGEGSTVTVTFSPVEERNYSETLTIVSNAEHGDVVIRLIGNGTIERIPDISVNPLQFNFGEVELGHPTSRDLTIANTGNSDLTISSMNIEGDGFTVNFDGERTIGAGNDAVYQVRFDPRSEENFAATLFVVSDDPDESEVEVSLSGTGFIPPQPNIEADPDNINFGNIVVGNIRTVTVTVMNSGDQPLGITGVETDDGVFTTDYEEELPDGPHFRFAETDGNHSLLILESLLNGEALDVDDEIGAFSPAGLCVGAVIITDPGEAVGVAAWGDDINEVGINGLRNGEAITLKYWDLSSRREIATRPDIIQGELAYARDGLTILNLAGGNQRQPEDALETVIQPGGSIEIEVTFEPTDFVDYDGTLLISSNDPDSPEFEIPLSGRGTPEPPIITVSVNTLDFGEIAIGNSVENRFEITNDGVSRLEGNLEIVGGAGSEYYSFEPDEFSLNSGQSSQFTVSFSPEEVGEFNSTLRVNSNDPETPVYIIELWGSGRERGANIFVEAAGGYTPNLDTPAHDFGQVFIGEGVRAELRVSNFGELPLEIDHVASNIGAFMADIDQGMAIDPGASAMLPIVFSPQEEMDYNGILTVFSNDADVPEYEIRVIGRGVLERLPNIEIANDIIDFEALFVGEERTVNIEGMNVGLANLNVSRVVVQGAGFSTDFQEGIVVAPNEGFEILVTFAPDQVGEFGGTATLFTDDPDEPETMIRLSGRAIPEGEHFEFVITAENMSIILEDASFEGNRLVAGDEVAVFTPSGFCAGATLLTDEWPVGVAAWGEDNNQEGPDGFREGEEIEWRIWDQSSGREYGAIADYEVGDGRYQSNGFAVVSLNSRREATPLIALGADYLNFGTVLRGESRSAMLSISNIGDGVLTIEDMVVSDGPFVTNFDGQFVIASEASAEIEVTFNPEEAGEFAGVLTITSDAFGNHEVVVDLSGIGVIPSPPQIVLSSNRHLFGEIGVGERETWRLTISNVGGSILTVEAPTFDGDGFEIEPDAGFEVGVGEAMILDVTFAPSEVRDYQSTLMFDSNDPDNGQVQISLVGSAVASPLHWRFQQTDGNMSLLIDDATLDGERLPIGAEVGVFTTNGVTAGSVRIEEYSFGLAAWGDDANTGDIVEGLTEGEALFYRIWLPELRAEFEAIPSYDEGEGIYHRDAFSVLTLSSTTPEGQGHFFYTITNANHSILVLSAIFNEEPLAIGDEVAAFTTNDICAGVAILQELGDQPFGFGAWGDDLDTQPVEGFANGERMMFRYWDASASREYSGVESIIEEGPAEYSPNGFTVLTLDLYTLPQPEIDLQLAHNFGRVSVEESASWEFVITNRGTAALRILSIGDIDAPFSINFEGEVTVNPGEAVTYSVIFAPEEPIDYNDELIVMSNDRNEPRVVVTLIGSGFNPNHAPVWVDAPEMVQGSEGARVEFTLTATDSDQDQLSLRMINGELELQATFVDHGDGTGTFTWDTDYLDAGEYTPLFVVNDGEMEAEIEVTIVVSNVNAPPEFVDYPAEIRLDEGTELRFEVVGMDVDGDAFQMGFEFIGSNPEIAPEFIDHEDGTASFVWNPMFNDAGSYVIRFHLLSDNEIMSDVSVDVEATVVDVNRAPVVVDPIDDLEINEDAGATRVADLNDVFSDPDSDQLSFDVSGNEDLRPAIDEEGVLWINPAMNFFGNGEVTVTADDGRNVAIAAFRANALQGLSSSANSQASRHLRTTALLNPIEREANRDDEIGESFTVTVLPVNDAPIWENVPAEVIEIDEDASVEFDVQASDIDSDGLTLTFERGNFPESATLEDHGSGRGSFFWMTGFTDAGEYRGELVVSDGELTTRSAVMVTVTNVNRPPVWNDVPEQVNGRENSEVRFVVTGSDPDNNNLVISLINSNLPQAATLTDHHDGTATFTWSPSFDDAGNYAATFRINDNAESADARVSFRIDHVNRPPRAQGLPDTDIDEDANRTDLFTLSQFFNDPDGDNVVYGVIADDALGAAINNGILSVFPADRINGAFNIVVSAEDNEFRIEDTFVLTVNPLNDQPFWVNPVREVTVREGERIEFALHADDFDLAHEGDELEIFLRIPDRVTNQGATFDHEGPEGTFVWATDFEDAGVYRPVFRVEDRAGAVADLEVTITINNFNRAPEISEPTREDNFQINVNENAELRIDFGADDADADGIVWTMPDAGGMPNGFQFTDHRDGTATLLWTPPFDARRQAYTPLVVATDAAGANDQLRLAISVANVNRNPVITEPANADVHRVAVEEGQRLIVDFRSTDPDGGNSVWELVDAGGLPNGWQFTDNQNNMARFDWNVPFDARREAYTPRFRSTDADNGRDEIVVEITVSNLNRAPVISQPSDQAVFRVNVDENSELRVAFLAADPDDDNIGWQLIDDGGMPQGWQFNDIGDGRANFIWTPGFNDARQDPYVGVFQARDASGLTDVINVEITVNNVNRPPVRQGQIGDVDVDEDQGRFDIADLRQFFTDPDNNALQFGFAGAPQQLGMGLENGNILFINPIANFNLAAGVVITVTATDGAAQVNQQFRVTVRPVNDNPNGFDLRLPVDMAVLANYRGTFRWNRSSDDDNDQLRYSIVFALIDAPIDSTFRSGLLADTSFSISGLDTLVALVGLEDSLKIRWWVEVSDGQVVRESNQRRTVIVPPLSAPGEERLLPTEISLSQNYPNPFNPETKLSFSLPNAGDVKLNVYDMHARTIATITEGRFEAGTHEFSWDGIGNSAGIYLFVLQVNGERHIVKGAMLK